MKDRVVTVAATTYGSCLGCEVLVPGRGSGVMVCCLWVKGKPPGNLSNVSLFSSMSDALRAGCRGSQFSLSGIMETHRHELSGKSPDNLAGVFESRGDSHSGLASAGQGASKLLPVSSMLQRRPSREFSRDR